MEISSNAVQGENRRSMYNLSVETDRVLLYIAPITSQSTKCSMWGSSSRYLGEGVEIGVELGTP